MSATSTGICRECRQPDRTLPELNGTARSASTTLGLGLMARP